MMRLSEPQYNFEQTIDECMAGITRNAVLREKLTSSRSDLMGAGDGYLNAVAIGELHTILPINTDIDDNPVVIGTLKKSELVKIYDQYFVSEDKPARKIYNALLNAAKESCPFCGGIGTPRNLDHFLPKAHFPQFSVLPRNLVPSCRDCNIDGKAQVFATKAGDQIIQPYADNDRFFMEQWIFATYHVGNNGEPGEVEYYVSPPESWLEVDKLRVRKHFNDFNLAIRYGTKAAEQLGIVLNQIRNLKQLNHESEVIQDALLMPGIRSAPFINHWNIGLYQALSDCIINL